MRTWCKAASATSWAIRPARRPPNCVWCPATRPIDLALLQATGSFKESRQNQGQGDPVRRQRGGDRLSLPWIADIRFHGDDRDRELAQRHPERHALSADQRGHSTRQQRRAAIGLERRRGRRCRGETECHQVREGNGQHSREHQFRHQDRGAEGFLDNSVVPYQISDAKADLRRPTSRAMRGRLRFSFRAKAKPKETAKN